MTMFNHAYTNDMFLFCFFNTGLGLLMVLISFDILWYYVVIMGWIQYFFVNSFFSQLPWSTCGNWWNTQNCLGAYDTPNSGLCEFGYGTYTNTTGVLHMHTVVRIRNSYICV